MQNIQDLQVRKNQRGEIIIYQTSKNEVKLDVRLEKETVWLNLDQIATLFDRDKSVISRHIKNIFAEKELRYDSVVAKFATTAKDGKTYQVEYYNLDAIISVGYRVKSQRGVSFRIWATQVLKKYLLQGYAVNEKRLLEAREKFYELQSAIVFLEEKSKREKLQGQEKEILSLLSGYSKTLSILEKYDTGKLQKPRGKKEEFILPYNNCVEIITELRKELMAKKEASDIFGSEVGGKFESMVKNLYQTFGSKELYRGLEEKAAHLLYLTIKDHPFIDGNKRIGSFLFVYFLDKNNYLYRKTGEKKINDNALTALALLIAESNPKEKEIITRIVMNLIAD